MDGSSTGPSVSPSAQLRPRDTFSCSEECRSADKELSEVICIHNYAILSSVLAFEETFERMLEMLVIENTLSHALKGVAWRGC